MKKHDYSADYFLFILPAFSLFFLFFLIPVFNGVRYSFFEWNGISATKTFVGLENFRNILNDKIFFEAFKNTLKFTVVHVLTVNLLALFLAVLLTKPSVVGRNFFRGIFFLPNVLSLIVVGQIWKFFLGQASFELGKKIGVAVFQIGWLSDPQVALYSTIIASVWQATGWYMLIYIAGITAIPRELYEAATIDGGRQVFVFRHITLPLLIPSLTICIFLSTINSLRVFDIVYAMTGGGPGHATETALLNIYNTTFNSFKYGYGTAKAIVLLIVIIVVSFTQIILLKRKEVDL
ncbi:carbohydrate ABC transporter permease [Sediminispirochaeta smaragdinae]|jgi:raffinose/stachyose/melibiose transport system permease protein|uniref:Binding-protein-dependent transport systems inner membrane component n=1 Tax=Sediminispirochaeta smaragdinae (strain DSM 11293 / JCM 15392 / SEBR 4228) TaxID=573413 RepID=E1R6S3_SEDSS|nr:sugar ABC transporter permease [Sediminispirochaeta smaragdinae]ADK79205.1 binding-protein-dependent transport systems inner membrane component [Sediminispirochaeta smaragdinae DSM 11293]